MKSAGIVALLVMAGVLAGCSSAEKPPESTATSIQAWTERVASCLVDKGWTDVVVGADGQSIQSDSLRASQREAFTRDRVACEDAAGFQPGSEAPTDDDLRAQYAALVDSAACLRDLGYETSDPPSVQVWVDSYRAGEAPWSPFTDIVPNVSPEEWDRIQRACPQP